MEIITTSAAEPEDSVNILRSQANVNVFECYICKKNFRNEDTLSVHIGNHANVQQDDLLRLTSKRYPLLVTTNI